MNPSDWLANAIDPPSLIDFVYRFSESRVSLRFHRALHAKIYLTDLNWSWVGSPNLTRSAFRDNVELVVEFNAEETPELSNFVNQMREKLRILSASALQEYVGLISDTILVMELATPETNENFQAAVELTDEILVPKESITLARTAPPLGEFIHYAGSIGGQLANMIIDHHNNISGHNRQGHVRQSYYALYEFLTLEQSRSYVETLLSFNLDDYPDLPSEIIDSWIQFIDENASYKDTSENISFSSLRNVLPAPLGGYVVNGGGASGTFRRMFPLIARFISSG